MKNKGKQKARKSNNQIPPTPSTPTPSRTSQLKPRESTVPTEMNPDKSLEDQILTPIPNPRILLRISVWNHVLNGKSF